MSKKQTTLDCFAQQSTSNFKMQPNNRNSPYFPPNSSNSSINFKKSTPEIIPVPPNRPNNFPNIAKPSPSGFQKPIPVKPKCVLISRERFEFVGCPQNLYQMCQNIETSSFGRKFLFKFYLTLI